MLRVVETYDSIQGESSYVGIPFVLVRLSGCNLNCTYCDTAYARTEGGPASVDDVLEHTASFGLGHVLVTGGEPLLQEETPLLLERMLARKWTVLIETNGSIDIAKVPEGVIRIMDIKTPDSGEAGSNRWDNVELLTPTDEVKFVICSRPDYEWARKRVVDLKLKERCQVLFSAASGRQRADELAEWILKDRLSVRLQVPLHRVLWPHRTRRT